MDAFRSLTWWFRLLQILVSAHTSHGWLGSSTMGIGFCRVVTSCSLRSLADPKWANRWCHSLYLFALESLHWSPLLVLSGWRLILLSINSSWSGASLTAARANYDLDCLTASKASSCGAILSTIYIFLPAALQWELVCLYCSTSTSNSCRSLLDNLSGTCVFLTKVSPPRSGTYKASAKGALLPFFAYILTVPRWSEYNLPPPTLMVRLGIETRGP